MRLPGQRLLRSLPLAVGLLVVVAASASAAPTLSRSAADPGGLVLEVASAPGELRELGVEGEGDVLFDPVSDSHGAIRESWTINAPDCAQNPGTLVVSCSAPVSSLLLLLGDGDEGVTTRKVGFPITIFAGGGEDFIAGGLGDDALDGGAGADSVRGDRGRDRVVGGLDDDTLSGGPARDLVDGGPGTDRLFGEGGRDLLLARDGSTDARIDCGPGSDRKERAKVDPADPRARSC